MITKYQIFIFKVLQLFFLNQVLHASSSFDNQSLVQSSFNLQQFQQTQLMEKFVQGYQVMHEEWYTQMQKLLLAVRYLIWRQKLDILHQIQMTKKTSYEDVFLICQEEKIEILEKQIFWINRCIKNSISFFSGFDSINCLKNLKNISNLDQKVPLQNPSMLQILNDPDL